MNVVSTPNSALVTQSLVAEARRAGKNEARRQILAEIRERADFERRDTEYHLGRVDGYAGAIQACITAF